MTPDEAKAVLLLTFATDQEMDDNMKLLIAKLLAGTKMALAL